VQIIGYLSTVPVCNSSPFYQVKDLVFPVNVHLGQHFTKPPSRYSEGALVSNNLLWIIFHLFTLSIAHFCNKTIQQQQQKQYNNNNNNKQVGVG